MSLYNHVMMATSRVQAELHRHGCSVEILGVDGDEVHIRLVAPPETCGLTAYTVKVWFERSLKQMVPAIRKVRLVATGTR